MLGDFFDNPCIRLDALACNGHLICTPDLSVELLWLFPTVPGPKSQEEFQKINPLPVFVIASAIFWSVVDVEAKDDFLRPDVVPHHPLQTF